MKLFTFTLFVACILLGCLVTAASIGRHFNSTEFDPNSLDDTPSHHDNDVQTGSVRSMMRAARNANGRGGKGGGRTASKGTGRPNGKSKGKAGGKAGRGSRNGRKMGGQSDTKKKYPQFCPCSPTRGPTGMCYVFNGKGSDGCESRDCTAKYECVSNKGSKRSFAMCIRRISTSRIVRYGGYKHRCRSVETTKMFYYVPYSGEIAPQP